MCVRRNGGERLHQRGDHDHRAALRAAIARDGNDRRWLRRRQLPVPGARVLPGRSARRLQAALAGMGHRHHGRRVSTCRLSATPTPSVARKTASAPNPICRSRTPNCACKCEMRIHRNFCCAIKLRNRSPRGDSGGDAPAFSSLVRNATFYCSLRTHHVRTSKMIKLLDFILQKIK